MDPFVGEARRIAGELRRHAVRSPSGGMTWIGPYGYGTENSPFERKRLNPFLYGGTAGVALLFAALHRFTQDAADREACLAIIAPLRALLAKRVRAGAAAGKGTLRIGGLIGLGSILYAFLRIGDLLGAEELIDEGERLLALIGPEEIDADCQVHVQMGSAGTILALLLLARVRPDAAGPRGSVLETAARCGEHLLAEQKPHWGRPGAWALSPGKPPLLGFSYGAAGTSYALTRLYEATGRREFLDGAREGFRFVRSFYREDRRTWMDPRGEFESAFGVRGCSWRDWWFGGDESQLDESLRTDRSRVIADKWCHGSAGLGLAKMGALETFGDEAVRGEIDAVIDEALAKSEDDAALDDGVDDACCGHIGSVEVLLAAAEKLGRDDCLAGARRLGERMLRRAEEEGGYRLSSARGRDVFAPAFFQGISGVGYHMLRLAEPGRLPSVLSLE